MQNSQQSRGFEPLSLIVYPVFFGRATDYFCIFRWCSKIRLTTFQKGQCSIQLSYGQVNRYFYCLTFVVTLLVVAVAQLPPGPLLVLVEVGVDVEALVGRVLFVVLEAHALPRRLVKHCIPIQSSG